MTKVYLDALGKELKVGSIVAVPNWGDQAMYFGTVLKLNPYKGELFKDESGNGLHRVEYHVNGEKWRGDWQGRSIMIIDDSNAIMLRLQNFEPIRE